MNILECQTVEDLNRLDLMVVTYSGKTAKPQAQGEKPWECYAWMIQIRKKIGDIPWTLPYYTGLGRVEVRKGVYPRKNPYPPRSIAAHQWNESNLVPKRPSNADVLYSVLLDSSAEDQNFNEWCSDYGYSHDSITALNTYQACLEIAANLRRTFTRDEINHLRTLLQDY